MSCIIIGLPPKEKQCHRKGRQKDWLKTQWQAQDRKRGTQRHCQDRKGLKRTNEDKPRKVMDKKHLQMAATVGNCNFTRWPQS